MWNKTELKPLGTCRVKLRNPKLDKKYSVEFVIVEQGLTPLLGLTALLHMNLITVNNENFMQVAMLWLTDKVTCTMEADDIIAPMLMCSMRKLAHCQELLICKQT